MAGIAAGALTQLTHVVASPAVGQAVVADSQVKILASVDTDPVSAGKVRILQAFRSGLGAVCCGGFAVAHLSVAIVAPGPDIAIGIQSYGMVGTVMAATCDGGDSGPLGEADLDGVFEHLGLACA